MKWTKKKVLYNALQLVFYGVVPLGVIFMLYGNLGHTSQAVGFKVAVPGILLLILAFLCLKKLYINRKLSDKHAQLNQHKGDLKIASGENEIRNLEREIKTAATVEILLNTVVPLLLFLLLILCCKTMEAGLVKLSGTCGFILLSYLVGTVFAVLDAREVQGKHKKPEGKCDE